MKGEMLTKLVIWLAAILLAIGAILLILHHNENLTIVHVATFYVGFAVGVFIYLLSEFEDKVKEVEKSEYFG